MHVCLFLLLRLCLTAAVSANITRATAATTRCVDCHQLAFAARFRIDGRALPSRCRWSQYLAVTSASSHRCQPPLLLLLLRPKQCHHFCVISAQRRCCLESVGQTADHNWCNRYFSVVSSDVLRPSSFDGVSVDIYRWAYSKLYFAGFDYFFVVNFISLIVELEQSCWAGCVCRKRSEEEFALWKIFSKNIF